MTDLVYVARYFTEGDQNEFHGEVDVEMVFGLNYSVSDTCGGALDLITEAARRELSFNGGGPFELERVDTEASRLIFKGGEPGEEPHETWVAYDIACLKLGSTRQPDP